MDSTTGRFTSKDPILYLNLYRYVKNNPMRYLDRFGLDAAEKMVAVLGAFALFLGAVNPGAGLLLGTLASTLYIIRRQK